MLKDLVILVDEKLKFFEQLNVELELQLGEAAIGCLSLCGELELVAGPDVKYEYKVLSLEMYSYVEVNVEMES